jgi:hypothetical protein
MYSLHSGDEMKRAKGEGGERYRLQALVHRHYGNQKWSGHRARQEPRMEWWTSNRQGDKIILVKLLVRDLIFSVISA